MSDIADGERHGLRQPQLCGPIRRDLDAQTGCAPSADWLVFLEPAT